MSRLVVQMSPETLRAIQLLACAQGVTIKQFVLEKIGVDAASIKAAPRLTLPLHVRIRDFVQQHGGRIQKRRVRLHFSTIMRGDIETAVAQLPGWEIAKDPYGAEWIIAADWKPDT